MEKFEDRKQAGRQLAQKLQNDGQELCFDAVFGLPRGGVIVAAEVARALNLPLGILAVAKVASLRNPEWAIGAVGELDILVWDWRTMPLEKARANQSITSARVKVDQNLRLFRPNGVPFPVQNSEAGVLIVDDGLATGTTMMAAIEVARKLEVKSIGVAVPVCFYSGRSVLSKMQVGLTSVMYVHGEYVGQYYESFDDVPDDEVLQALNTTSSGRMSFHTPSV